MAFTQSLDPTWFAQQNPMQAFELGNQIYNGFLQNQITGAQVPYAGPQAAANLAQTQAQNQYMLQGQLPYAQANAANTQAQTNLLQQQTPLDIQQLAAQAQQAQLNTQQALKYPNAAAPGIIGTVGAANYLKNLPPPASATVAPSQVAGFPGTSTSSNPNAINTNMMGTQQTLPQTPGQQNSLTSLMGPLGHPQNIGQAAIQSQLAPLYKAAAEANLDQQKAQNFSWTQLPPLQQQQFLAQLGGMGIPPNEAISDYNQGKSIGQIAQENGFDPNQLPDPVYPTTTAMQTTLQKRNQADAELNSLNQFMVKAISPYAQTIHGYSPAQIADGLAGSNPNQQAMYFAAKALSPEIAGIRMRIMNGQVGIGAIQELIDASNSNLKSFGALMTPQIYAKTQNIIQQQLQQALGAANAQTQSPPTSVAAAKAQMQQQSPAGNQQTVQATQNWKDSVNDANLQATAQKYGLTVDQVKQQLGIQ